MKDILISKDEVVEKLVNTMIKTIHEIQGVNEDTPIHHCSRCCSFFEVYPNYHYCPCCGCPIKTK